MLHIRPMKANDFQRILELTNHERWEFVARDLRRMLTLSPRGCLVAELNRKVVGFTTSISYGNDLGWIGNVVVEQNYRGAGIGSSLVESAVRHLLRSHVKSVGLNCYPENRSMYEQLGFKQMGGFVTLSILSQPKPRHVHRGKVPIQQILKLDREIFGADRARLLRLLLKEFPRGWTWIGSEPEMLAYSVVKEYRNSSEIGPSVCKAMNQDNVAALLQYSIALPAKWPLELSVPDSNRIVLETAARVGFRFGKAGLIMSFGKLRNVTVSPAITAFGFLDKG